MRLLEMKIVLPTSLDSFFTETGYVPSIHLEERRSPRMRIRCEAFMSIESSPPTVRRDERESIILVKDVSKRGSGDFANHFFFARFMLP